MVLECAIIDCDLHFTKEFLQNLVTWPQRNLNAELAESRFLFLLSFFFLSFVYNAIRHLQYIHYLGWEFHPVYLLIVQKDKKKTEKNETNWLQTPEVGGQVARQVSESPTH